MPKRNTKKRKYTKNRKYKKSKKKMKGGSFIPYAITAGGVAAGALLFKNRCKICNRTWKSPRYGKDWIWSPESGSNNTTLTGIHFYDFIDSNGQWIGDYSIDNLKTYGVCGICNGDNMYNNLVSKGENKLTAKIKVIKELLNGDNLDDSQDAFSNGVGKIKVNYLLIDLKELENSYKRLALAKIIEIPIDLYERISYHLTTILNE